MSAAGRGEKTPPNHEKSLRKPDRARSRWKRESLLPYRLVSQSVSQAGRRAGRQIVACAAFSLVSRPYGICLPGPQLAPAHAGARTWDEFPVSECDGAQSSPGISDVLPGSVLSFHSHTCFVNARLLFQHILVQVLCGNPDPSRLEDVRDGTSVAELRATL